MISTPTCMISSINPNEEYSKRPYKVKRRLHRLSKEEKEGILEIVKTTPEPECWKLIVKKYNLNSIRTAREHYKKYMMFDSSRDFTPDEDKLIVEKVNEIGQKWVKISALFPDKSDINIRNRYRQLMRKGYKINEDITEIKPLELPEVDFSSIGMMEVSNETDSFSDFKLPFENNIFIL